MFNGASSLNIIILIAAVMLSAFFSLSEAAFLSVQRTKVRHLVNSGVPGAQRMARLVEHPERFLPVVLVGNNLVNSLAVAIGTIIAVDILGSTGGGALAATFIVALLLIFVGESVPKTLGSRSPEKTSLTVAGPIIWVERVMILLTWPLQRMNRFVAKLLGGTPANDMVAHDEIKVLISLGRESGTMAETEAEMLLRTLGVTDRTVGEVMTPRTEIVWVEEGMSLSRFLEFNARQFHSRFPVFNGTVDNVTGVLATKDVLRALGAGKIGQNDPVTDLKRPAQFIPESSSVVKGVGDLREKGVNQALVVDEFGGVAGLVTFKQLMAQIVGDNTMEEDRATPDMLRSEGSNTFHVKGSMRLFDVNEKLGLNLPEGDYQTLAGYLLSRFGEVPQEGQQVTYKNLELTVAQMKGPKIEEVTIIRK